jgi:hypothetical protein
MDAPSPTNNCENSGMIGKAVRIRHYPVTVSDEARPQATGELFREGGQRR